MFESLVTSFLTSQLSGLITTSQHGFMGGRSVCTNLIEFVNFCISKIENGAQIDVIYTAIKKAFDTVNHTLLLNKLYHLGKFSALLAWTQSYISDRKQFVRLSG